jgi:hypothetical protein
MNLQAIRMPATVGIIAVIGVAAYFQLRSDPQGAPQFAPVATGGGAESDTAGAAAGRLDMVLVRVGDSTAASGGGLLSAVLFDAVGAGVAALTITGSGSIPGDTAVPLDFSPIAVTVR